IAINILGSLTTVTHGLGVAPDFVYITPLSTTGGAFLVSSTTQIVTLGSVIGTCAVGVEVHSHHSIIG
ncbi:MAG: hypothetical protein Q8K02_02630, partial [Flavobacterium sp.]|nr:hypothetical protein [Flavobacterium sp.]